MMEDDASPLAVNSSLEAGSFLRIYRMQPDPRWRTTYREQGAEVSLTGPDASEYTPMPLDCLGDAYQCGVSLFLDRATELEVTRASSCKPIEVLPH